MHFSVLLANVKKVNNKVLYRVKRELDGKYQNAKAVCPNMYKRGDKVVVVQVSDKTIHKNRNKVSILIAPVKLFYKNKHSDS